MIITCPNCQKEYNIPDSKIPSRDAKTTCKVCSHSIPIKGKDKTEVSLPDSDYTCSKCGLNGDNSKECTECGVIFSKFLRQEEAKVDKPPEKVKVEENESPPENVVIGKDSYYIEGYGELSWDELQKMAQRNEIYLETDILVGRTSRWVLASSIPSLFLKDEVKNVNWGVFIIALGVLGLFISFNMDTTVWSGSSQVNNIGLMNDKQNYIIVSSLTLLIGVIVTIFLKSVELNQKECPKCTEQVRESSDL